MRALILACGATSLALACGSGSKDDNSGKTIPAQSNLTITTTGRGLVRGAGTDCRGSCRAQIAVGSPVHLVAVPDSGAFFVGWAGSCGGTGACDLMLDVDRDVSATFGDVPPPPPPGKHGLVVVVQGKGRVTSSPAGIDCVSGSCNAQFDSGASVTLTAAPAAGFSFSGWGSDCSGPGTCTLTLSKDATVFASFIAQPPPPPVQVHLTVSVKGPGAVTGAGLNCGESVFTCDVMVATGTTVTLTANPAGATRFSGWGGACSGTSTTCGLTLQSDTTVTAEFQSEVLVLAPNDGTNFTEIALNSTHLFWMRFLSGSSGIWSVPKNGGDFVNVTGGRATAIVADDGFLYWTDGSNLYSTPVAGGGEVALLATGSGIGDLALDELGALYWVDGQFRGGNVGTVHRMQSRADSVLATGENTTGPVAVDATHVYYGVDGSVRRVPRAGGMAETIFSCDSIRCTPVAVRADPRFVYFRISSSTTTTTVQVLAWRKADRSVRVISGGNANGLGTELDANGSVVYWNSSGGSPPFGIFQVNSDGTGFAPVDTSNDPEWRAVRVDDVAVYYWHAGAIIRRLK